MHYKEAGNWAFGANWLIKSFLRDVEPGLDVHKMLILPDCVNFGASNVMAWGEVNGKTTWLRSNSAAHPRIHVHEFGHNLGMRHSGNAVSSYGDGNGYMGNKAARNDEGSAICFNAAKTWHFNWFPNHHATVVPSTNVQEFVLNSLSDVGNRDYSNTNSKMILKLESSQSTLFINFNRAKGLYDDVLNSDKVVITQQNSATSSSKVMAALQSGGNTRKYEQSDWDGSGKTLIVEVVNIDINWNNVDNLDNAKVKIYVSGGGNAPAPAPAPTLACNDFPNWYDLDGPAYDCEWYAKGIRCATYGDMLKQFGMTANTACCVCKK